MIIFVTLSELIVKLKVFFKMKETQNPEALHDVGQDLSKKVKDAFVNPGTPSSPLVTREQMTQATIKGSGTEELRNNLIK